MPRPKSLSQCIELAYDGAEEYFSLAVGDVLERYFDNLRERDAFITGFNTIVPRTVQGPEGCIVCYNAELLGSIDKYGQLTQAGVVIHKREPTPHSLEEIILANAGKILTKKEDHS